MVFNNYETMFRTTVVQHYRRSLTSGTKDWNYGASSKQRVTFLLDEQAYKAPNFETGEVGRPAYLISKEQLEVMRSYGLKWIDIAKSLGKEKNIRIYCKTPKEYDSTNVIEFFLLM
jgi:hypothetical protein